MKTRKSILLLTLALTLSFVLVACGSSNQNTSDSGAADTAAIKAGDGNILVAYFSVMETDGVDTVAGASRVVEIGRAHV